MKKTANKPQEESIQIIRERTSVTWNPCVGEETIQLLNSLYSSHRSEEEESTPSLDAAITQAKQKAKQEALDILSHCVSPQSFSEQRNTGLVVGYVQSGKTRSFTMVSALAHDNGYPIVVIITGTKIHLTNQSVLRLRKDLRLGTGEHDRPWCHVPNPVPHTNAESEIKAELDAWNDDTVPQQEKRTVLITVMKHHKHLANLTDVLRRFDLNNRAVLIVDDEADQASLNTKVSTDKKVSSTYRELTQLRKALPLHTLLQYTATPQAPLLISLIDILSPDFASVLTPGDAYVGGKAFFTGGESLVQDIPTLEINSKDNPLHEPPETLLEALRIYFLGVASARARGLTKRGNRSMMVHPSIPTDDHKQWAHWVQQCLEGWRSLLHATMKNPNDPDRVDLLEGFRAAYEELGKSVKDLESFEELKEHLPEVLRKTKLAVINSVKDSPKAKWLENYAWIIVGGLGLDRGFTVEGLTVTYMPRGVGVGHADTIQQRARFFGYKRSYLEYCRVYLEHELHEAFKKYVEHEENIRHRLTEHVKQGLPLQALRRAFLLDPSLKPTRANILEQQYLRIQTSDWTQFNRPHEDFVAAQENRLLLEDFFSKSQLQFKENEGSADRTQMQRHGVVDISLRELYDDFLTKLRMPNILDSKRLTMILIALEHYLLETDSDALCSLYYMSGGKCRERSQTADGRISELFQGADPVSPPDRRGKRYPGDREIRGGHHVTVQIHRLDIKETTGAKAAIIAKDVPTVAIWIDPEVAKAGFVQ